MPHGAMGVDADAEHFAADPAIEALDHAVGLGRAGPDVAVLHAQIGTGFGECCGEATAVVGQHVGEPEGESGGGLVQEGDGAPFGLVVLSRKLCAFRRDREVDGSRAAVDGREQVTLAPFAV